MSSSYKDSFTRGDSERDLQYDDSAFWFFCVATLTCATLPLAISLVRSFLKNRRFKATPDQMCHCKGCLAKQPKILARRSLPFGFYKKLFVFMILFAILFVSGREAILASNFKSFDPYELLEIQFGASDKEIKVAYRKMARKHHPDLNPGDPLAANRFIQINKAYECLIDPKFRENCAKYGNPEGHKSFQVGIALPTILLKKENSKMILSVFFLMLLLAIVLYTILLQGDDTKNKWGISMSTMSLIHNYTRNDNLQFNGLIEMCSFAIENRKLAVVKHYQIRDMAKIERTGLKSGMGKNNINFVLKPISMMHYFMKEEEDFPECFEADLKTLQVNALAICMSFYERVLELVNHKIRYGNEILVLSLCVFLVWRLSIFGTRKFGMIIESFDVRDNNIENFGYEILTKSGINLHVFQREI